MRHFGVSQYYEDCLSKYDSNTLDLTLSDKLSKLIITHRNEFVRIFITKYCELLPMTISYKNVEKDFNSVDFTAIEVALRLENRGFPVICRTKKGNFIFCGFINRPPITFRNYEEIEYILTEKDITFIVDRNLFDKNLKEISYIDNCKTGDFVVFTNKVVTGIADIEVVKHYAIELAEMISSRLSLIIQSKVNTFVTGDESDVSIDNLIQALYNGNPFSKVSSFFDIDDNLLTLDKSNIINSLTEIKRQYQNSVNELNLMLGINTLGVDKESGVSDEEAKSNLSFVYPIASSYLTARQDQLNKLNIRFGYDLLAEYNRSVTVGGLR